MTTYAMNMNGTKLWTYQGENDSHAPTISNDGIIVLASYDQVTALNPYGKRVSEFITGDRYEVLAQ